MSTSTPSTVILRGSDEIEYKERPANVPLRPGMAVEYAAGGIQPHGEAGVGAEPRIVIENRKNGMLADDPDGTDTRFEQYAADETTLYGGLDKGHQFYGLLAAGATVADGTPLVSDGAGGFRPANTGATPAEDPEDATVEAIEVVDNAAGTGYVRCRMEVR